MEITITETQDEALANDKASANVSICLNMIVKNESHTGVDP